MYMAEHSGYEQTGGRVLNTLENFADIKALCISAIDPEDARKEKAEEMFKKAEHLAKHLYNLLVFLKSQKKRCPERAKKLLLDFFDAWDATFTIIRHINKLHFLMEHVIEFIERYGVCGRF